MHITTFTLALAGAAITGLTLTGCGSHPATAPATSAPASPQWQSQGAACSPDGATGTDYAGSTLTCEGGQWANLPTTSPASPAADPVLACGASGGTWDGTSCTTPAPSDPATATPPAPVTYKGLSDRQWEQIAKDPDTHADEAYIVYGKVTQFDAATGQSEFRADVGGTRQYPDEVGYVTTYPTNTVLSGDSAMLKPIVEGDLFTAEVQVTGSLTYDTQIGGSTTVPELQINSITVTGH